jgi:hypothetical protein
VRGAVLADGFNQQNMFEATAPSPNLDAAPLLYRTPWRPRRNSSVRRKRDAVDEEIGGVDGLRKRQECEKYQWLKLTKRAGPCNYMANAHSHYGCPAHLRQAAGSERRKMLQRRKIPAAPAAGTVASPRRQQLYFKTISVNG